MPALEVAGMKSCSAFLCFLLAGFAEAADFQSLQTIPNGLGANIHFTNPQPGEMDQLAAAGCKFVRMDFSWVHTEKDDGSYDFSHYDTLMRNLDQHHIRALFILDSAHPKHDNDLSPHTDEGRAAFVKWAMAGVGHFQNRGILWEMFNEPNIKQFWHPKPSAEDYSKLAIAVGKELKLRFRREIYIGPAMSTVDLPFLEACCKAGVLEYFDAVSVHPYRPKEPESVQDDYRKMREVISKYAPKGKSIPIFSGEWGYSAAWKDFDPDKQGKYLARQWLTNIANDVNLSIWYDWHDDGLDPKEGEHHFGTVLNPIHKGRAFPYDSKPAYLAARTLTSQLVGYRFSTCTHLGGEDNYLVRFTKRVGESGEAAKYVAWTTSATPRQVLAGFSGHFAAVSHLGAKLGEVGADDDNVTITLTDAPIYLTPIRAPAPAAPAAIDPRGATESLSTRPR
jgi:hypothetical protein